MVEHRGIGPVSGRRALRHHDHERPAVGMVAHRFGEADLGLPHAFGAALAAPVQKQDDGPLFVVVAPPILGQVHLKAVHDAVQLDAAIQESGILRRLRLAAAWVELLCRQRRAAAAGHSRQASAAQARAIGKAGHRSHPSYDNLDSAASFGVLEAATHSETGASIPRPGRAILANFLRFA